MPTLMDAMSRVNQEYFKKPSEVGVEGINDVIFTGTSLRYFKERFRSEGVFKHSGDRKVFLSNRVGGAYDIAIDKSRDSADEPVVVVVDSRFQAPDYRVRREGVQKDIVCEQIPRGAILAVYKVRGINGSDFHLSENQFEVLKQKGEKVALD